MRRISISLTTVCGVLIALALPTPALAILETSQVTAPASSGTVQVTLGTGGKLHVAGTATFSEVEIRCYSSGEGAVPLSGPVPVTSGAFTAEVSEGELPFNSPCQLRAVPVGEKGLLPPGEETEFKGPLLYTSGFEAEGSSDFIAASSTQGGSFTFEDAGLYGLESELYSASARGDERLFFGTQALNTYSMPPAAATGLKIDGETALLPAAANELEKHLREQAEKNSETFTPHGVPALTTTKTFNEATRQIAVTEEAPAVRCSPTSTLPATTKTCTSFVGTGVTLVRTYVSGDEDHVAQVNDAWRSTNGLGHTVAADYLMELFNRDHESAFQFPGATAFGEAAAGERKTFPSGPGEVLYKTKAGVSESGDGEWPQAAIVWDSAPNEPVSVVIGTDEIGTESDLQMPYDRTVPAGGSTATLRMGYAQSFSMTEVRALAQSLIASFYPSVSITSPSSGASIVSTAPDTTVTGTAGDGVAVSSLTVNGKAVPVGAGGAWSTSVALSPGTNTITAVATDQSGLTASSAVTVTYAKPIPPATASQLGNASGARGRVSFRLACAGTRGTICTIHAALTTIEKLRGNHLLGVVARARRHSRTVTVGSATIILQAGQTAVVTVPLSATGRKLLARFHTLPVHLLATLEPEPHRRTTLISQNLTVRPVPHKRRHH